MRLRTDTAEAHRTGTKTLDDFAGWLNFVQRDRVVGFVEIQQPTQGATIAIVRIDLVSKLPIRVLVFVSRGDLQIGNRIGRPSVLLAFGSPVVLAHVGQLRKLIVDTFGIAQCVTPQSFFGDDVKRNALDATGRADETLVDDLVFQSRVPRRSARLCNFAEC